MHIILMLMQTTSRQSAVCTHYSHNYSDFNEILTASVRLAKLAWGCPAHGSTPEIPPLYSYISKHNDCSVNKDPESHDGSFSLATTIIKGKGQDSIAPAVQVNTEQGSAQITAVLNVLHELC
jgi:hypothetical protein